MFRCFGPFVSIRLMGTVYVDRGVGWYCALWEQFVGSEVVELAGVCIVVNMVFFLLSLWDRSQTIPAPTFFFRLKVHLEMAYTDTILCASSNRVFRNQFGRWLIKQCMIVTVTIVQFPWQYHKNPCWRCLNFNLIVACDYKMFDT